FSIIAGFIIVGVASKTSKVKELTRDVGITKIADLARIVAKKEEDITTSSDTVGLQPGALVHVGEKLVEEVSFQQIEYDKDNFIKKDFDKVEDCLNTLDNPLVSWTNITGIHDSDVIKKIGDYYKLHVLIQADIMNTELRPKIDNQNDHIFLIIKLPHVLPNGKLFMEQISLIVGKNFVISFQETKDDVFDPIRDRIEKSIGTIRQRGSDYLAYAIVDAIIDHYYVILESIGAQSEDLEEELMANPGPKTLQTIHLLKREMVILRKSIWPMREVIDGFERMESDLIDSRTKRYLRDVYSHTVQVMDNIEGLRDMVGGMLDTYLSSVGNKMNEIMKTLTIIASIFIPITFIAGLYGTNFVYVPELTWEGSYFAMLGVMAVVVIIMVAWFRKKEWL
ncbi:magnesium/cobalt transporter CorA, partial [Nitrosopumilus sp. b1]|uniref:magnesium/cobalt transporter CorA n=1 Tax=Nitrosopumilus sp. b1 TaxID=2109907 RepID=UPI001C70CA97